MSEKQIKTGEVVLKRRQYDSRKEAGTLKTGTWYKITDDPTVEDLLDGSKVSMKAKQNEDGESIKETYQRIDNLLTSFQSNPDNSHYVSEKLVKDCLDSKVDKVQQVSTNINNLQFNSNDSNGLTTGAIRTVYDRLFKINGVNRGVIVDSDTDLPDIYAPNAPGLSNQVLMWDAETNAPKWENSSASIIVDNFLTNSNQFNSNRALNSYQGYVLKTLVDGLELNKQNKLTAGDKISINGDTISVKMYRTYKNNATFYPGDIVNYNGVIYICILQCTGEAPSANSVYWTSVVSNAKTADKAQTQSKTDNTDNIATTKFVKDVVADYSLNTHNHTCNDITDIADNYSSISHVHNLDEILDGESKKWNDKLDKISSASTYQRVYGVDANGSQLSFNVSSENTGDTVPLRTSAGAIFTATPTDDYHATNKKYVDDRFTSLFETSNNNVLDTITELASAYASNKDLIDDLTNLVANKTLDDIPDGVQRKLEHTHTLDDILDGNTRVFDNLVTLNGDQIIRNKVFQDSIIIGNNDSLKSIFFTDHNNNTISRMVVDSSGRMNYESRYHRFSNGSGEVDDTVMITPEAHGFFPGYSNSAFTLGIPDRPWRHLYLYGGMTSYVTATNFNDAIQDVAIDLPNKTGNYAILDSIKSTSGKFIDGVYNNRRMFYYLPDDPSYTDAIQLTLLDDWGNSEFPGLVRAIGLYVNDSNIVGNPITVKSTAMNLSSTPTMNMSQQLRFFDNYANKVGSVGALFKTDGYYGMALDAGITASMGILTDGTNFRTFAPTPADGDNSEQIATTAFVKSNSTKVLTGTSSTKADNVTKAATLRIGCSGGILNIWDS